MPLTFSMVKELDNIIRDVVFEQDDLLRHVLDQGAKAPLGVKPSEGTGGTASNGVTFLLRQSRPFHTRRILC